MFTLSYAHAIPNYPSAKSVIVIVVCLLMVFLIDLVTGVSSSERSHYMRIMKRRLVLVACTRLFTSVLSVRPSTQLDFSFLHLIKLIKLNLAITDGKALINYIWYKSISVFAKKRNKRNFNNSAMILL